MRRWLHTCSTYKRRMFRTSHLQSNIENLVCVERRVFSLSLYLIFFMETIHIYVADFVFAFAAQHTALQENCIKNLQYSKLMPRFYVFSFFPSSSCCFWCIYLFIFSSFRFRYGFSLFSAINITLCDYIHVAVAFSKRRYCQ